MQHPHFLPRVAVALCAVLSMILCFSPATRAGDPDLPTGPGHHGSGSLGTSGDPDSPTSTMGDPDSPTGTMGDPDSPTGTESPRQILSLNLEHIGRSQVLIHVAFKGDPDVPGGGDHHHQGADGFLYADARRSLNLYDVTGRLRRQWNVDEVLANGGQVGWNMTDNQGNRMAAGIYFVRFQAGRSAIAQPVLVLR